MLSRLVTDLCKGLAKAEYGIGGIYAARNKKGEEANLQFAIDLVAGRAILLKPTAMQAAFICNVPLLALQNALTSQGSRKAHAPKPTPAATNPTTPAPDAELALEHALNVLGPDVVFGKAKARAATVTAPNGAGNGTVGSEYANTVIAARPR